MKPWLAPLAAGCMAESGSRLPQFRDFVGDSAQMRVCFWPSHLVLLPATSELRTPTVMANNRDADTIIEYSEEEMIRETL